MTELKTIAHYLVTTDASAILGGHMLPTLLRCDTEDAVGEAAENELRNHADPHECMVAHLEVFDDGSTRLVEYQVGDFFDACSECGEPVYEGDPAVREGGQVRHKDCPG